MNCLGGQVIARLTKMLEVTAPNPTSGRIFLFPTVVFFYYFGNNYPFVIKMHHNTSNAFLRYVLKGTTLRS